MAWITPVFNRQPGSRTKAVDMNRIVNNMIELGGSPIKTRYTNEDIVRFDEWKRIVDFARALDTTITDSTHYLNLNKIELAMYYEYTLNPSPRLFPSSTLYPR